MNENPLRLLSYFERRSPTLMCLSKAFSGFKIFLLSLLFIFLSCVYSFRGFSGTKVYSLYVDLFKNTSEKAGIESDVTKKIIDYFEQDARVNLVSENKADYKIKGTIAGYKVEPYDYKPDGTALSYRVILMVYLTIEEKATKSNIKEDVLLSGWGTYSASEREEEGLFRASEDIAKKILQEFLQAVQK